MFLNDCTACGKRQLICPSQVWSYLDTSAGLVARHVCWCGASQDHLFVRETDHLPTVAA